MTEIDHYGKAEELARLAGEELDGRFATVAEAYTRLGQLHLRLHEARPSADQDYWEQAGQLEELTDAVLRLLNCARRRTRGRRSASEHVLPGDTGARAGAAMTARTHATAQVTAGEIGCPTCATKLAAPHDVRCLAWRLPDNIFTPEELAAICGCRGDDGHAPLGGA